MTDPLVTHWPAPYRGRFAPSPTGPLHFGSLVAAVGSYLQARTHQGEWLVRMEDVDSARTLPGADSAILHALESLGLEWNGPVMYQSQRLEAYAAALEQLQRLHAVYPCACSRREVADSSLASVEGPIYPGTCRAGLPAGRAARAWRVRTQETVIDFHDGLQGNIRHNLATDTGDFIVRRADGFYAYQLAVVVDDAAQGITEIVRGLDILPSTARQIHLQRLLTLPTLSYLHLPIAINLRGEKLSKQTGSPPVKPEEPVTSLIRVLHFLGQGPPEELAASNLDDVWKWAKIHWHTDYLPVTPAIIVSA